MLKAFCFLSLISGAERLELFKLPNSQSVRFNTLLDEVIGPSEIKAEFDGRYAIRDIGTNKIRREEKLSNPALTLTSSATTGTIRSHSMKRSWKS